MYYLNGHWVDDAFLVIPMPLTAHEDLEAKADLVRTTLFDRRRINLYIVPGVSAAFEAEQPSVSPRRMFTKRVVLTRTNKYYAPAPFVGDPLTTTGVYCWDGWVCPEGRWITMDDQLELMSRGS